VSRLKKTKQNRTSTIIPRREELMFALADQERRRIAESLHSAHVGGWNGEGRDKRRELRGVSCDQR